MAGDVVQIGEDVEIGFQGYTLSGYTMNDASPENKADIKEIRGENNAVMTKLLSNPRQELSFVAIPMAGTDFLTIKTGDVMTVNSVAYMVVSAKPKLGREEDTIEVSLIKEDSMTYAT